MKIIGVGNESRGDDGIGVLVARSLQKRNLPGVSVEIHGGDGALLMDAWKKDRHVIVVDCAASGSPVGTIHHFLAQEKILDSHFFATSTHTFGVAEAIELARVLGELPEILEVYAIEGGDFSHGEALRPAVRSAGEAVINRIVECTVQQDNGQ